MKILRSQTVKLFFQNLTTSRLTKYWGIAFSLFIFAGYQILTYRGISSAHPGGLVVVSAFAPVIIVFLFISWSTRYRIIGLASIIAGGVALWHYQNILVHYLNWTYMIQRSGIFALLATVFGVTLLPGRTPMVSRIADLVHGPLNEQVALYTRHVTTAWALFFATMTALPLIIFIFAPHHLLFLLTNIITVTLVVSMLFAEYIVRCRTIPVGERSGMMEGLRAYFHYSGRTAMSKQQPRNSNPKPLR
ncbi:MAG: COG4648 family protein [Acidithiobacillus ferriphilus]